MRKYAEATMDVVLFEGTAAEIVTESPVTSRCLPLPCRGEDQTPIITSE
uniref:Uncharacterized protein n=1 Tax=Eubacterium cellulosolvens (strain ATCC 43171 / JCM 9499 / 6) TaxID=633697 RepID=I5AUZ5_EUBC6